MGEKGIRSLFLLRTDVLFKTQAKGTHLLLFSSSFLVCLFVFDELIFLVSHGKKADITVFFICLFFALIKKFSSYKDGMDLCTRKSP